MMKMIKMLETKVNMLRAELEELREELDRCDNSPHAASLLMRQISQAHRD